MVIALQSTVSLSVLFQESYPDGEVSQSILEIPSSKYKKKKLTLTNVNSRWTPVHSTNFFLNQFQWYRFETVSVDFYLEISSETLVVKSRYSATWQN